MRRNILLYIADQLVDIDSQELVLFNYTMEDLSNPTIVKNSYTQQITLKGTPRNNKLFGDAFRLDRVTAYDGDTGASFNANRKNGFVIYNEMNEVLESGYCKLDEVERRGADVSYKVTLYGGLGGFIYSLAYNENGDKRTLADLNYLPGGDESELDFIINADAVSSAWDTEQEGDIESKWQVINFAPTLQGIPDGDFAPNKGIISPSAVGLGTTYTDDKGVTYGTQLGGNSLVSLEQPYDEWDAHDLRSYLQRPVLSMRAFWNAIAKPENNGGYQVDASFLDSFAPYSRLWMTLPRIPSLGTYRERPGTLSLSPVYNPTANKSVGRINVVGSVPSGTTMNTRVNCKLRYYFPSATSNSLSMCQETNTLISATRKSAVIFAQLLAFSSDGVLLDASNAQALYKWDRSSRFGSLTPAALAQLCKYRPERGKVVNSPMTSTSFNKIADGIYEASDELHFSLSTKNVSYYIVYITAYTLSVTVTGTLAVPTVERGNNAIPMLYEEDAPILASTANLTNGTKANTITHTDTGTYRSGAQVTKQMLLSTSKTPADYLLSFCKMFGIHILFDKDSRAIRFVQRDSLYNRRIIDLSHRLITDKPINITPFAFTAKWYEFKQESVGGAFQEEYKANNGREYGSQIVNTNYVFDSDTQDLLKDNAFKSAATILARSPYFCEVRSNNKIVPSVFLTNTATYKLYSDTGSAIDLPIQLSRSAVATSWWNDEGHNGYDIEFARKIELRTADNKPVDGTDVLLFREGFNTYPYFNLSDDTPEMDSLNDGKPCWLLTPGDEEGLRVPIFQRYLYSTEWNISDSLDFGIPKELNIPEVTYSENATIYAKYWSRYIRDRYDIDTKVMRCFVDFGGMQVGSDLLRQFYWYEGSLWVLNAIKNYSLTTYDPVECEFVQVQDIDNYFSE